MASVNSRTCRRRRVVAAIGFEDFLYLDRCGDIFGFINDHENPDLVSEPPTAAAIGAAVEGVRPRARRMLEGSGDRSRLTPDELEQLVARARAGDGDAWAVLVRSMSGAVYRGLSAFNLSADVREELFHETFVRLVEKLDTIRSPQSLAAWLITTAGNGAKSYLRRNSKYVLVAEVEAAVDRSQLDENLLDDELKVAMLRAFRSLPEQCQRLLRLASLDSELSYVEISQILGIPQGSIGPTRGRCLDRLRRSMRPFLDSPSGGGTHDVP